MKSGWLYWERERQSKGHDEPVEQAGGQVLEERVHQAGRFAVGDLP